MICKFIFYSREAVVKKWFLIHVWIEPNVRGLKEFMTRNFESHSIWQLQSVNPSHVSSEFQEIVKNVLKLCLILNFFKEKNSFSNF